MSEWIEWPGSGLEGRDLGLEAATDGALSARHVRSTGDAAGEGDWHCYDLDFEILLILGGSLTLEVYGGSREELVTGSTFFHPSYHYHRDIFRSADFEALYLTAPAAGERFSGLDAELLERSRLRPADQIAVYSRDDIDAYRVGSGAAAGLLVRDLGVEVPSGGRVRAALLRSPAGDTDTGLQADEYRRWIFGIAGTATIEAGSGPDQTVGRGDDTLVPAGTSPLQSGDGFAAFELCLLADIA